MPGLIGGEQALAAYTPRGQLGILETEDYGSPIRQHERTSFIEELRKAQARGEGIEDVIRRLSPAGEALLRQGPGEAELS